MPTTSNGTPESEPGRTLLVPFTLEGTRYCVDVDSVTAALGIGDYEAIEEAPDPWYAGELTFDGEPIRVVDLARAFGSPISTPERAADPQLLVFEPPENGKRVGWLVDDVSATRPVDPSTLDRSSDRSRFVRGVIEFDDDRAVWLNERAINE